MNFSWSIILVSIWAPVVYLLGAQWSVYEQYNYGWAVPFLCLVLAAQKKTTEYGTTDYGTEARQPKIEAGSSKMGEPRTAGGNLASAPSPISDLRPPPSALGPLTSDLRPPPSDLGPQTSDLRPQTSDLRPPISAASPVVSVLLVFAALLYWAMRLLQEANPVWRLASYGLALSAVAMTLLLIYLTQGRARMMQFVFPVAFFLVAVPWPTPLEGAVIQTLTRFNATLVVEMLGFASIPALLHGNVIEISTGLVGIDEACSGIRSLQATLMIALFFGAFYRLTWARRGWLLAAGPALALAFNFTRTLTLVLIASRAGLPAMEKWHDRTGVALLLGCFSSLWAVALWLRKSEDRGRRTQDGGQMTEVGGQMTEVGGQRPEVGGQRSSSSSSSLPSPPSDLRPPPSDLRPRISDLRPPTSAPAPSAPSPIVSSPVVSSPVVSSSRGRVVSSLVLYALTVALSTEAWFRSHEARGNETISWAARWPTANPTLRTNAIPPMARRMLQCDQDASANWSDDAGVFWQAFYLRWLPAETFYGRTKVAMSKSHNPAICLPAAGMKLLNQLDPVSLEVRPGFSLTFDRFVFLAGGRELFVFFAQTEDLADGSQANLRTTHLSRLRAALTGSRNYGERNFEVALTGPASPADALRLLEVRLPELIESNH